MRKLECELPKRKKNRLENYDYSQCGAYFLTICVQNHEQILWENNVGATCGRPFPLSNYGQIINNEIQCIPSRYNGTVYIDKYAIMPNHIHLIIVLQTMDVNGRPQVAPTISRVVKQFKGAVTKQIGWSMWQKSFHNHIIRNNDEYEKIWDYIEYNPINWQQDCYFNIPYKE